MTESLRGTEILIVEDDRTIADSLAEALQSEGSACTIARDGDEAEHVLRGGRAWSCILLDLMLPGPSGLELLAGLRSRDRRTPVLILTARSEESDKVLGLELGADDYITKPFSLRELFARIRVALRRHGLSGGPAASLRAPAGTLRLGACTVDFEAMLIIGPGDREATISPKEAAILQVLWQHAGKVRSRDQILDAVWGRIESTLHRTIDSHVRNLRKKIEPEPKAPRYLRTAHGVGYRLTLDA